MSQVILELFQSGSLICKDTMNLPVSVGRQDTSVGDPAQGKSESSRGPRFVIAEVTERSIPRYFFRIEASSDGGMNLCNTHSQLDLVVNDSTSIGGMQSLRFDTSQIVALPGNRSLRLSPIRTSEPPDIDPFRSLNSQPLDPASIALGAMTEIGEGFESVSSNQDDGGEHLLQLLQQVLPVVRESASSDAFFRVAASAALKIAGLNRVSVFLFQGGQRQVRAEVFSDDPNGASESVISRTAPAISESMLSRVKEECLTKIHDSLAANALVGDSLQNLRQAVAAPIMDKERNVIGVLYGDRWLADSIHALTDIEAKLVEILASAISAGIARLTEEKKKASMSNYFSEAVAKHIADNQSLLEAKEENVSILFCDVRKFSTISKALGATKTVEWMQDIFTMLSQCVEQEHGVVMNYVGDELIAMWGAPDPQEDHPKRAMRAAVAMLRGMSEIEERWGSQICEPLKVGIGINSGLAAVGNTGSRLKFQYGAFGNVVNIASRLQSATKQFGVDCLLSQSTVEAAKDAKEFCCRELATIQVVGIPEAIVVSQLIEKTLPEWPQLQQQYESALRDYKAMRFADATQKLGTLLQKFQNDEPSMRLLGLSVSQLRAPSEDFSPVDSLSWK